MDLLNKLLNQQTHFSRVTVTIEEVKYCKKDFDILLTLEILEKMSDPQYIWCRTCQNESVKVHYVSNGRAYTLCTQDEYADRDYFNLEAIKQWSFNTLRLILLFFKALGIDQPNPIENIDGLLWNIGTQKINGVDYYLFFCRNINEVEKPKLSIITNLPHSVVFYTGTPQIALPNTILLIPIIDLIQKITNKGILLNKELVDQFFPKNVYATKEGSIELDDNLVFQDNRILSELLRPGVFKKRSAKLRPLAGRIISHLYGIRTYQENSKSLDEIAEALDSTKVSISNEIGRIEKTIAKNNIQAILHKYTNDKWGINPQLKCCK